MDEYYGIESNTRRMRGVYPVLDGTDRSVQLYYLHPQFVVNLNANRQPTDLGDDVRNPTHDLTDYPSHVANLCLRCHVAVTKQPPQKPRFSLAKKHDYGDITRILNHGELYPRLTIAEEMAISKIRQYCITINLSINRTKYGTQILKSHMIAMPFSGPETLNARQLPLLANEIQPMLKVIFVGSDRFKVCRNSLLKGNMNA
jgi:hypothetical protein